MKYEVPVYRYAFIPADAFLKLFAPKIDHSQFTIDVYDTSDISL
ncbi:hypothetical protein [Foetidibacter luteolus]|nr:hypothetical protein [Foetidibacter luteolus]